MDYVAKPDERVRIGSQLEYHSHTGSQWIHFKEEAIRLTKEKYRPPLEMNVYVVARDLLKKLAHDEFEERNYQLAKEYSEMAFLITQAEMKLRRQEMEASNEAG